MLFHVILVVVVDETNSSLGSNCCSLGNISVISFNISNRVVIFSSMSCKISVFFGVQGLGNRFR